MQNRVDARQKTLFNTEDHDPTAFPKMGEYSSHTYDRCDGVHENKGGTVGADRTAVNWRPNASQVKGTHRNGRSRLPDAHEEPKKVTRRVDCEEKSTLSSAFQPCNYTHWDKDMPPIDTSSRAYKEALYMIRKKFPDWQHKVALSGEILLDKVKTREQRHALIKVAEDFGFNSSNPRTTTCSFAYVKQTNHVFMRATGEKIPHLDYRITRSIQHLERRHQAYLEWRSQQEKERGDAENVPQGGGLKRTPSDAGLGEGSHKEHTANASRGRTEQPQPVSVAGGLNYREASSVQRPCVLQWWFVDRYVHRDVLEILRLLACEIGVFRGEPTPSFKELERYDVDAAKNLDNSIMFRIEVALEYQLSWEEELAALLKEEPGSALDPYPISYVRRDKFAMKQYQLHLRPFFYDWRPGLTRCFVDLFQGRDFRANATPSSVTTMGTSFFLRHEIDTKGQVFYRRWVRHSLDLFGNFSSTLRRQDAENVRETFIRLYREHQNRMGRGNPEGGRLDRETMLELLKQAKNATPHFGTLNLCIEFHFFKKDLLELQKFSARYGYFVYIRRDEGMVYVAATARDLPVLPPHLFELFFLPNGAYVGSPALNAPVDMRLGVTEQEPTPVPPSLLSLLEEGIYLTNKRQHPHDTHGSSACSSVSSYSSDSVGRETRRRRRSNPRSAPQGRKRGSRSSSLSSSSDSPPDRALGRGGVNEAAAASVAQPRRYAWPRSLPASSLYDVMVGAGQRLRHPPGCTVESHLVAWTGGEREGRDSGNGDLSQTPRVYHFALNHLTREAHIIGG